MIEERKLWAVERRGQSGRVKTLCGILALAAVLAGYIASSGGCATWRQKRHDEWVKACGPQVPSAQKPCSCEDPKTPNCYPLLHDAARKDGGPDR
jgi:hypothetical protein